MPGQVVIDCFPESLDRYGPGWTVVAVDVIRATTTAVTAVATGGACYPAANLAAAREPAAGLERPLLDGDVPSEFDLDNSPAALSRRTDVERPAVLLSTTGTRLLAGVASCTTVHAACLRNLSAQVRRLVTGRHQRVVVEKGRHASGWACYSAGGGDWAVGPQCHPRLVRSTIAPTSWRQELSPGADR